MPLLQSTSQICLMFEFQPTCEQQCVDSSVDLVRHSSVQICQSNKVTHRNVRVSMLGPLTRTFTVWRGKWNDLGSIRLLLKKCMFDDHKCNTQHIRGHERTRSRRRNYARPHQMTNVIIPGHTTSITYDSEHTDLETSQILKHLVGYPGVRICIIKVCVCNSCSTSSGC